MQQSGSEDLSNGNAFCKWVCQCHVQKIQVCDCFLIVQYGKLNPQIHEPILQKWCARRCDWHWLGHNQLLRCRHGREASQGLQFPLNLPINPKLAGDRECGRFTHNPIGGGIHKGRRTPGWCAGSTPSSDQQSEHAVRHQAFDWAQIWRCRSAKGHVSVLLE